MILQIFCQVARPYHAGAQIQNKKCNALLYVADIEQQLHSIISQRAHISKCILIVVHGVFRAALSGKAYTGHLHPDLRLYKEFLRLSNRLSCR